MPGGALAEIQARGHIGIRLGLARMRALLARLDDPQASLRGVLIAGTNGKGSVAAMVASMLNEAGVPAARSSSPHLSSYRERIVVDGELIGSDALDALLEEVLRASEPGETRHGPATEFELLTAAAFLWSARQQVDVAVVEVGLGGRLDATNTWDADVAAISNVTLDHQLYLGDTVEAVAAEKAAIIKAGSRAVTAAAEPALGVIRQRARTLDVPLTVCAALEIEQLDESGLQLRHDHLGLLRLSLLGRYQAQNAAVALAAIDALEAAGIAAVDDGARIRGLARTRWPGRMELLDHRGQAVLLDGAHNPAGAAALAATIDELGASLPQGPATLLLGVMADKEVEAMLVAVAGSEALRSAHVVATAVPDTDRSLAAADLAVAWDGTPGTTLPAVAFDDADVALSHALDLAPQLGGPVVVAGSLYLIGHVRSRLVASELD